jgi:molybdopterin/thiamine biosynthesis adenylyltransferase
MGPRLIVPEAIWSRLRSHLFQDGDEHLAFLFAQWHGDRVLAQSLEAIPDYALETRRPTRGLILRPEWLVRVLNSAVQNNLALIEAHNHPGSGAGVAFSHQDLSGQRDLIAYLSGNPVTPTYGAIVLGEDAVAGQLWRPETTDPIQLREVFVPGDIIRRWPADGRPATTITAAGERFDRQVRALGQEGQRKIAEARVAIVGLGGTGSIITQQLAHLGVGRLLLIDQDHLELSNLNRVVGASSEVIGRPKVEVAAELVHRINPAIGVEIHATEVMDSATLALSTDVDLIVGCVDSDAARLVMTAISQAYLVPYIDCAVGITGRADRVTEAGGRVVTWVPGRACLVCCREIDLAVAAQELESSPERAFRQAHGYVAGAHMPDAAVISLNGTVASLAATELVALLTGLRSSVPYTYYDLLEQRSGQRAVKRDPGCPLCAIQGRGSSAGLDRFLTRELPADLPRLK